MSILFSEKELEKLLFPHPKVRETQDRLLKIVSKALEKNKDLIVHAPTGLGKTAATLAPALAYAQKNNLTVFFLTSRHTQHRIVIDTMKKVKEKFNNSFIACSIVGKKWMCAQPEVDLLRATDFHEFCKSLVEEKKCEFYMNTCKGKKPTPKAAMVLDELKNIGTNEFRELIKSCSDKGLCPYETACLLAVNAKVIITDYYYIFNPAIRQIFFNKTGKSLEGSIIIIDEGHNLANRIRNLMTYTLTSFMTKKAITEAKRFGHEELVEYISQIQECLLKLSAEMNTGQERLVTKKDLLEDIKKRTKDINELIADFEFAADAIRLKQRMSYIGSISGFLEAWQGPDDGFARIMSLKEGKREPYIIISYRCLDPSIVTKDVIDNASNTIIMSGTLMPTEMYSDLLGFSDKETIEEEFDSPFPEENRLNMIIPRTTTKYDMRSEKQYEEIAKILKEITDNVPGNSAVFFPSYELRNNVNKYFQFTTRKHVLKEMPGMTKQEKEELLEKFKGYGKSTSTGSVLLGATAGSFGEGIDLPGKLLKAVVVVGLPLSPPDLETKELIRYYEETFNRGWDYGYILPAFIKCLQNAGRCIRSETDKGIVVFLDQRYTWSNYFRLFPEDMNLKISMDYVNEIKGFFSEKS